MPPPQRRQPRPAAPPPDEHACEADVLEGLADFAADELVERLGAQVRLGDVGPGALAFRYRGDLRALLGLRSVLAAYLVLRFDVPRPKALLGHQHFERLLGAVALIRGQHAPGTFSTLRLSAAGEDSSVLVRLKDELAARTGLALADDEGDLLMRLRRARSAGGWECLLRLSPRPLATRAWRVCNMPGAPNATLAHAMMQLSEPAADDVVLNLMCGSGTLLVERLALGPARAAIGCDTDPQALGCAQANLAAAGYAGRARLEPWDATALPLPDGCANVLCADLPFGQIVGSHRENELLYPRMLAEAARVAAAGTRMVLLTHEVRLLERVAAAYAHAWEHVATLTVRSSGMTPRIFAFVRR